MSKQIHEVGTEVWIGEDRYVVTDYAKGWYEVAILGENGEVGDETKKVRAKQFTLEPPTKKREMSETLRRYRVSYEPCVAYSGRKSLHNGDPVAELLEGMSPAEVLATAERILGLETGELAGRYAHLNPGQQRMNGGNRIRAALKRGDIQLENLH